MLSEILKTNRGRERDRFVGEHGGELSGSGPRCKGVRLRGDRRETERPRVRIWKANGRMAHVPGDRSSLSAGTCRADPFDSLIVGYYEGNELMYAAKVRNGFVPQVRREVSQRFKGLQIDLCPFRQSSRKETHAMGANERGNEKLPVAQTRAGGADRVRGVDAGRSFEAFEICGVEGGQRPR
jgi:hypothetical protein